ncbi:MAG: NADH:ubiquinone oxidoreductase subunit NDUFA12 [Proteobacteria bacterium]|nr:NADH:ubiquinone oxidoreductase subunit NDUFA12 [Pseudomonadota bacterium]
MGFLSSIFTWWNGATWGTALFTRRKGGKVGEDQWGNVYFQAKKPDGMGWTRRWVIYKGANDASRVPPEWQSWLYGQAEDVPDKSLPPARAWEKPPVPNLTGTAQAYRPPGALESGKLRAASTGDYEAWSPDAA